MRQATRVSAPRSRRAYFVGFAAAAAALVTPQAALQGQNHAAAVAVTSTPGGAVPSIGAGAVGGPRRALGIRYGRLTDRIVEPETEEWAGSTEIFERDVYTAELSMDMFGGGVRLQLGRAHTRYRREYADTVVVASPTGVVAALGYGRQLFDIGTPKIRVGIGTDLSAGFADLVGERALSAHGHLPLTVRAGSGPTQVILWGAPGTAWGSLRGQNGTINTASAGLRIELPSGTAVDITGTQLLGDFEAIWGGSRARISAGVSHSFGSVGRGQVPQFPPAPRPRYSAANDSSRTAAGEQPAAVDQARGTRPRNMPQDSATMVAAAAPAPEAAPAVNAPSRPTSGNRTAPGGRERSIFYSPHEASPSAAPTGASAAPAAAEDAAPSTGPAQPPTPAAVQPTARVSSERGAATARPTNSGKKVPTRYTVQAGAVKDRDEAIELRIALGEAGFPARILEDEDYFRVRVGLFTTRAAAEQFARRIRAKDFEAWVTVAEPQ